MMDEQCSVQTYKNPWRCENAAVPGFRMCMHHRDQIRARRNRFIATPNQCNQCTRQVFGRVHCDEHREQARAYNLAHYHRNREVFAARHAAKVARAKRAKT